MALKDRLNPLTLQSMDHQRPYQEGILILFGTLKPFVAIFWGDLKNAIIKTVVKP